MKWRVIGTGLGFFMGGIWGASLGLLIGYVIDTSTVRRFTRVDMDLFCKHTFAVMGHVAKADGRVSEHEIEFAEALMRELGFSNNKTQRSTMQNQFRFGKSAEFDLNMTLINLRRVCHNAPYLYEVFMEVLIKVALADGQISAAEMKILHTVREQVGLSMEDFRRIESRSRAEHAGRGQVTEDDISASYKTLGVTVGASQKEIKRAYRRLISANHPDKLSIKDATAEELKAANDKTRTINRAYDTLSKHLGSASS